MDIEDIRKDFEENREEWIKMLEEETKRKRKSCTNKNGRFDYLKMAEMYHNGKW